MPTATGRETADERSARQRAEMFAAIRAAITEPMRDEAATLAASAVTLRLTLPDYQPAPFPAGDAVLLTYGRRPHAHDTGELRRLALVDACEAVGLRVISHTSSFGIGAGRDSITYGIRLARG